MSLRLKRIDRREAIVPRVPSAPLSPYIRARKLDITRPAPRARANVFAHTHVRATQQQSSYYHTILPTPSPLTVNISDDTACACNTSIAFAVDQNARICRLIYVEIGFCVGNNIYSNASAAAFLSDREIFMNKKLYNTIYSAYISALNFCIRHV